MSRESGSAGCGVLLVQLVLGLIVIGLIFRTIIYLINSVFVLIENIFIYLTTTIVVVFFWLVNILMYIVSLAIIVLPPLVCIFIIYSALQAVYTWMRRKRLSPLEAGMNVFGLVTLGIVGGVSIMSAFPTVTLYAMVSTVVPFSIGSFRPVKKWMIEQRQSRKK